MTRQKSPPTQWREPLHSRLSRLPFAPTQLLWKQLLREAAGQVMSGPFQGMRYMPQSIGSEAAPKLLGCYEKEIHPLIEKIKTRNYDLIINVGAAEGYYAVGFARSFPNARVIAYEANADGHRLIKQLSDLNKVSVEIRGMCRVESLREALEEGGRVLVVMDCEGGEDDLLELSAVPALSRVDVLVETHEGWKPGVTQRITERFQKTHEIEKFSPVSRTREDCVVNKGLAGILPDRYLLHVLDENRGKQTDWLWMEAKHE